MQNGKPKIEVKNLNFYYGKYAGAQEPQYHLPEKKVTAIIGLRMRKVDLHPDSQPMNDVIPNTRVSGEIYLDGQSIVSAKVDVVELRKRVAWFFKSRTLFPNRFLTTWLTDCGSTAHRPPQAR